MFEPVDRGVGQKERLVIGAVGCGDTCLAAPTTIVALHGLLANGNAADGAWCQRNRLEPLIVERNVVGWNDVVVGAARPIKARDVAKVCDRRKNYGDGSE